MVAVGVASVCAWPMLADVPEFGGLAKPFVVGLYALAMVYLADRLGRVARLRAGNRHGALAASLLFETMTAATALLGPLLLMLVVGRDPVVWITLALAGLATAVVAAWLRQDPEPQRSWLAEEVARTSAELTECETRLKRKLGEAQASLEALAAGLTPSSA